MCPQIPSWFNIKGWQAHRESAPHLSLSSHIMRGLISTFVLLSLFAGVNAFFEQFFHQQQHQQQAPPAYNHQQQADAS